MILQLLLQIVVQVDLTREMMRKFLQREEEEEMYNTVLVHVSLRRGDVVMCPPIGVIAACWDSWPGRACRLVVVTRLLGMLWQLISWTPLFVCFWFGLRPVNWCWSCCCWFFVVDSWCWMMAERPLVWFVDCCWGILSLCLVVSVSKQSGSSARCRS